MRAAPLWAAATLAAAGGLGVTFPFRCPSLPDLDPRFGFLRGGRLSREAF